jgi:Fur family ferric uptake transcriptional regulator
MRTAHHQRRSLMQKLVAEGVRMTNQRRVLVETIQEAKGRLDAAPLLAMARKRDASIDRATVYRTIDLLKRRGLIDEGDLIHLSGEKHFYDARMQRDHMHLACLRCGRVEESTTPLFEKLKGEMARQSGFEIQVVRLEVGGLCKACAKIERRQRP